MKVEQEEVPKRSCLNCFFSKAKFRGSKILCTVRADLAINDQKIRYMVYPEVAAYCPYYKENRPEEINKSMDPEPQSIWVVGVRGINSASNWAKCAACGYTIVHGQEELKPPPSSCPVCKRKMVILEENRKACTCQLEIGDSPCELHDCGECASCGDHSTDPTRCSCCGALMGERV